MCLNKTGLREGQHLQITVDMPEADSCFWHHVRKESGKMENRIAKIIRMITVPPIVAAAMLLIFWYFYGDSFINKSMLLLELLFLVAVPVSAYPVASLMRNAEKSKREQQRKFAFVFNFAGYFFALLAGIVGKCSRMLLGILAAYFMAVVALTVLNKICKARASGHACSCVLPYLFFCRWLGSGAVMVCGILYLTEFWASVKLKRHTVKEFLAGSAVAVVIFLAVTLPELL